MLHPLTNDKSMLGFELLSSYPNISHFITTRSGVIDPAAPYDRFNCSPFCGDDPITVVHNQQFLREHMQQPPLSLIIPHQTHGTEIATITSSLLLTLAIQQQALEGVDALITDLPGHALCISTADCVPLMLYDPIHQAIGAIHAGWRGTQARIVSKTIHALQTTYGTDPAQLIATIGPSISLASFEVGDEVRQAFANAAFPMEQIATFDTVSKKWHIDLWEANRQELIRCGLSSEHVEVAGICTYIHYEQFFSARRLSIRSGRILSGIMLNC